MRTQEAGPTHREASTVHRAICVFATVLAIIVGACGTSAGSSASGPLITPGVPSTPGASSTSTASPTASVPAPYGLGHFPAPPTGALPAVTASALQAILDRAVPNLPGVSATVIVAGRGTWSGAAGTADDAHAVEVDSSFGIASLTKTVIAAEIMLLADHGKLALSDPVSAHLPADFTFDTNGATIGNLLAMESGIPDPALDNTDYAADLMRNWSVREVLATVPAGRSKPGDRFVYEDANYMLLGMVVAQATGQTTTAALRSGVLADPRFAALVYQPEEKPRGPLALPHVDGRLRPDILARGGGFLPSKAEASEANGSGCMASDAGSLALWGYQLFGGAIVSPQAIQAMTNFVGGDLGPYGMGVFDQTRLANGYFAPTVGNGGDDDGGYSSVLSVLPGQGIAIAVLTNEAGNPRALVMPLAQQMAAVLR
jgi:D-alanyl-D-alanine carboxypeptidase